MVLHLLRTPTAGSDPAPRIGLIVNRRVGDAVTRNRVKRRVRHLAGLRAPGMPPGSVLVVRVSESAKEASSGVLATDFDSCLRWLLDETR